MPISASDVLLKYSTRDGTVGHSLAQSDPDKSLGKFISTSQWSGAAKNDLFNDIKGDDNEALTPTYRCIFIHNNHASLSWQDIKVWIDSIPSLSTIAIGLDPAGAVAKDSASAQAAEVADEYTAPSGVTFTSPTDYATGLAIPLLTAGQVAAVWLRLTPTASSPTPSDGFTLMFAGDSEA